MGGVTHARLKNLATGTTWEHGFRSDLKIEEIPLEKRSVEFLYQDSQECNFMDPENYEQMAIPAEVVGDQARLLVPEMKVTFEFVEGKPVGVTLPDVVEVKIADTAPPMHSTQDNTWKTALLENGLEIMVPPFVKTGDVIRLSTSDIRYMDRARTPAR
jgi:elongation factor P